MVRAVDALAWARKAAVNLESEDCSLRDARLLTLAALIFVAGGITLANLSSQPATKAFLEETVLKGKSAERAFGWPLTWYWRSRSMHSGPAWTVSRCSTSALSANVAMWIAVVVVAWAACATVLRRFRPRLRRRPRFCTLMALLSVVALTVLANLSCDHSPGFGLWQESRYGWPLIWYWRMEWAYGSSYVEWDYSAWSLVGNVALWLLFLVVAAVAFEWLIARFRRRLWWSLRAMLAGVAVAGALCAWLVAVRNRTNEQDAVIQLLSVDEWVYYERSGPQWFDLFGADRLRRRIVAAHAFASNDIDAQMREQLLTRLAGLSSLRFLDLAPSLYHEPFVFTPHMAASLARMRQLRMLNVNCQGWDLDESRVATQRCLAAVGNLTRLERLRMSIWANDSDALAYICNLVNLKTLGLDVNPFEYRDESFVSPTDGVLAHLPTLPQLEVLYLHWTCVADEDLDRLAGFPRLKSLDLSYTSVSDAGLAKLAFLESLEELAIDEQMATEAAFKALLSVKQLSKVHIGLWRREEEPTVWLSLDDGKKLPLARGQVDSTRRALAGLRESHPGITIDANYADFATRVNLEAPWPNGHHETEVYMQRWLHGR